MVGRHGYYISYFGRFRERVGTRRIGKLFKAIVNKAKETHLVRGVFHFVDATSIITKNTTWAELYKAIKEGEEAKESPSSGSATKGMLA